MWTVLKVDGPKVVKWTVQKSYSLYDIGLYDIGLYDIGLYDIGLYDIAI